VEFMKRLLAQPSDEPMRRKVAYLTALVLLRKRRLKLVGHRNGNLLVEKSWDGDAAEVPAPDIPDAELETLKVEMEKLFEVEFARADTSAGI
jgi:hypothetical protein